MTWITFDQFMDTHPDAGPEILLLYPAEVWGGFIPLVLFGFFMIILLGSYFATRRLTGRSSFISSFAVSSYATTILTIAFSLIENLVDPLTLVIPIVVSILATILLFFRE